MTAPITSQRGSSTQPTKPNRLAESQLHHRAVQPWTSYLNSLCLHCSSVKWAQTGSTSHGRQAGSQGLHAYTVPSTQGWPSLGDEPTRHPLPLRDKDISTCYQALPICSLIGDRAVRRKTFHKRTPARDGICPQEQKYQVGIFFFSFCLGEFGSE